MNKYSTYNIAKGGDLMKSFAIVTKKDELSLNISQEIKKALESFMFYDEKMPELVISIGGDGTMLDACHQYMDCLDETYFVGVHTGTLGFYTDYDHSDWEKLVQDILKGEFKVDESSILEVKTKSKTFYALNEMRLEENHRTMVCDVYINHEFLECFRGNGLCVSTPSGSTAYNRSLGGSVVAASIPSLQLSEIAGIHHNAYRSLQSSIVLDKNAIITLKPHGGWGMILGIDRWTEPFDSEYDEIDVSVSEKTVKFARFNHVSLCQRLRRAFISE